MTITSKIIIILPNYLSLYTKILSIFNLLKSYTYNHNPYQFINNTTQQYLTNIISFISINHIYSYNLLPSLYLLLPLNPKKKIYKYSIYNSTSHILYSSHINNQKHSKLINYLLNKY